MPTISTPNLTLSEADGQVEIRVRYEVTFDASTGRWPSSGGTGTPTSTCTGSTAATNWERIFRPRSSIGSTSTSTRVRPAPSLKT